MKPALRTLTLAALFCAAVLPTVTWAVSGDITFPRKAGQSTPSAVFPHWFHRIRFRCYACHPAIFPMKITSEGIGMDQITAGQFCGKCHNGKIAWAVGFSTCRRCHTE